MARVAQIPVQPDPTRPYSLKIILLLLSFSSLFGMYLQEIFIKFSSFEFFYSVIELDDNKILNVGLLLVATLLVAKLISALVMPRSK